MTRSFICGGAGFIGSHLAVALLKRSPTEEVVVYDNLSSGTMQHLEVIGAERRFEFIHADLKDIEQLSSAMRGVDTVYHLAANPDISKAVTQPDIDFWEGTYLAQNVIEAMRRNHVSRIFYTSGSGVYGEAPEVRFSESFGPCLPISTYGASKLACEALICAYCHMFGITGRAFRFANVVGARQTHGVGYDFVRRLRNDPSRLRILGDGSQSKSYIHVDDVLNGIFHVAAEASAVVPYDIFNVATDDYLTVHEIADIVVQELRLEKSAVSFEYTGGDRGWKGDVPKVLFDVSKIKQLGWQAKSTSREAIATSVRSMIDELEPSIKAGLL